MSDPDFDIDDGLFTSDTLSALDAIEQRAIAASQAPRKSTGLHHVVAAPRASPRPPAGAGQQPRAKAPTLQRAPPPLNTEPRVAAATFGWGENGKHHVPGNTERVVAHWNAKAPAAARTRADDDDESPLEISVDEAGNYGLGAGADDGGGIIDGRRQSELRRMVQETQAPRDAALQRRQAIEADRLAQRAAAQRPAPAPPPPAPAPATVAQPQPARPVVNRQFTRSASTGSQVLSRPTLAGPSRAAISHLPAIPSQSSGSAPSSQGAVARRSALELESALMREQALKAELDELKRAAVPRRPAPSDGLENIDPGKQLEELQNRLFTAQGEAAQARRAEKEAQSKHEAEKEKLRAEKLELEEKLRLRETESKQRIETMRTQALFNQHHAVASATKRRAGSQRPSSQRPASPHASPSKTRETVTPLVRTAAKPRAPQFGNLHNAFNTVTPVVARPKRLRTEEPSPTNSPSRHATPLHDSPTKSVRGSSPAPFDMETMDWQPFERPKEEERSLRAEIVYHVLHYVYSSLLQEFFEPEPRPTVYRILQHQVSGDQVEWDHNCSGLLDACSDPSLTFAAASKTILGALVGMVELLAEDVDLASSDAPMKSLLALINPISLLSSILTLFPTLPEVDPESVARFAAVINRLTVATTPTDVVPKIESAILIAAAEFVCDSARMQVWSTAPGMWLDEWMACVVGAAAAVCLCEPGGAWSGDQLAETVLRWASPRLDAWEDGGLGRAQAVADLFLAAACRKANFKPLISPVAAEPGDVPVVDTMARYLVSMPIADEQTEDPGTRERVCHDATLTVLAAFSMLTLADSDAHILIADRSALVPALLTLLAREGQKVWGMDWCTDLERRRALELVCPALILLHALVYPPPRPVAHVARAEPDSLEGALALDPPAGLDLARRLHEAGAAGGGGGAGGAAGGAAGAKEFAGLQHVFVSAVGAAAYGEAEDWPAGGRVLDRLTVQYLAQDLLEAVIEGPEGDALYAIYAPPDDDDGEGGGEGGAGGAGGAGGGGDDMDVDADGAGADDDFFAGIDEDVLYAGGP